MDPARSGMLQTGSGKHFLEALRVESMTPRTRAPGSLEAVVEAAMGHPATQTGKLAAAASAPSPRMPASPDPFGASASLDALLGSQPGVARSARQGPNNCIAGRLVPAMAWRVAGLDLKSLLPRQMPVHAVH